MIEEDLCALLFVLENVLEGLLKMRLLGVLLVLRARTAAVIHLDHRLFGISLAVSFCLGLTTLRLEKDLIGEELVIVEDVLEMGLWIAIEHLGESLISEPLVITLEVVVQEQHTIALTILAHPGNAHKE